MGLFGFGKSKQETSRMLNPQEFLTSCTKAMHDRVETMGFAKRGVIFIPELMTLGQKETIALLQNDYIASQYSANPTQFYFAVMGLVMMNGMVFAAKWHENFSGLNDYADEIRYDGPSDDAYELSKKLLNLDFDGTNKLLSAVFNERTKQHEPYWKLSDPRNYTFAAMMSAYQVGISVILERLGY